MARNGPSSAAEPSTGATATRTDGLSGAVDGAYGDYRSTRTITVGDEEDAANAKPRQWQIGTHVRAAYSVPMGSVTYIKPFVDGHAIAEPSAIHHVNAVGECDRHFRADSAARFDNLRGHIHPR